MGCVVMGDERGVGVLDGMGVQNEIDNAMGELQDCSVN
jgi:hypothetical protein